jgi:hypothetical protein
MLLRKEAIGPATAAARSSCRPSAPFTQRRSIYRIKTAGDKRSGREARASPARHVLLLRDARA